MATIFASNEQFFRDSDSKQIQAAVNYAADKGFNRVVVSRVNIRTGKNVWDIDEAILLPSNMTIVLEDAHLRLVDGVMDNIFRNENAHTELGKTLEGEQSNINIIGQGNALLDGGVYNGVCEQMHRDEPGKYKWLSYNLLVFLHNVRDFQISGVHVENARYWSICLMYCRFGRVDNINFKLYNTGENQDGLDLRIGCEFITIENLTGITGDDTLALTALPEDGYIPEKLLKVAGKSFDIHDISVRNIISCSHGCGIMRFLCEDTAKIYNVTVDGIKDTGETISGTPVIIGTGNTDFAKIRPHVMGEFRNITIRNISTCAQTAISVNEPVQDMLIENVSATGDTTFVGIRLSKNFQCDNFVIRNVVLRSSVLDSAIYLADLDENALIKDMEIENVTIENAKYIFRGSEYPVKNLKYSQPTEEYFVREMKNFPSAYGRYHLKAFGKVISNRPEGANDKDFLKN